MMRKPEPSDKDRATEPPVKVSPSSQAVATHPNGAACKEGDTFFAKDAISRHKSASFRARPRKSTKIARSGDGAADNGVHDLAGRVFCR